MNWLTSKQVQTELQISARTLARMRDADSNGLGAVKRNGRWRYPADVLDCRVAPIDIERQRIMSKYGIGAANGTEHLHHPQPRADIIQRRARRL